MENNKLFSIGDTVSVTLVGKVWGTGEVEEISSTSHGGSLLFPVFLIRKNTGEEIWVPPISISLIVEG
jgi:hypothetical protein